MILNSKIPEGPLEQKWENYKKTAKLVNPANRKKLDIIVVGTGLAGSSVAASLGEMGYNVKSFCFQDSARRAHSVAAQGGVNAAKNYKNDGELVSMVIFKISLLKSSMILRLLTLLPHSKVSCIKSILQVTLG